MGHGIKYLDITTDPVQLWASPHSRSRVEREFFDSNFAPFYRIEQVRITKIYSYRILYIFIYYLVIIIIIRQASKLCKLFI